MTTEPLRELLFALEKYPERVEATPIGELTLESARQNSRRPAYIKLAVPDDLVKNLRGRVEDRETVLVVRVPKEVAERVDSPIVLPGEVR